MATLVAAGGGGVSTISGGPVAASAPARLSDAQTGDGPSTNVVDRGGSTGPVCLRLTTTIGGGPTCTYAIQGSPDPDDVNSWVPIQYADSASPQTLVVTTFAITTATTVLKYIPANVPLRYIRVVYSLNTAVTNTVDAFIY